MTKPTTTSSALPKVGGASDKTHPSYHLSRGFTLPLPSGGRRRQIGASP